MTIGRNDPCPCGSGKKYKKCCAIRDAKAEPVARALGNTPEALLRESAKHLRDMVPWEVGTMAGSLIENDPTARPVLMLIVADQLVLHGDLIAHPASEPDTIAAQMATAILDTIQRTGKRPSEVRVQHRTIAYPLSQLLRLHGIPLVHRHALTDVLINDPDDTGFRGVTMHLAEQMQGHDKLPMPTLAHAGTWAGWGLPTETIAELFTAAAQFYRARPWVHITNMQALTLTMRDGTTWTASIMGNGGQEFGLALYEDETDLTNLWGMTDAGEAFGRTQGMVLSLTFDPRHDLPRPMQHEVVRAGWEVAEPDAYPLLFAINTPGNSVSRTLMRDLIQSLQAAARFAQARGTSLRQLMSSPEPLEWKDTETGITVMYGNVETPNVVIEDYSLWEPPISLTPGGPEGENADQEAVLAFGEEPDAIREQEMAIVRRFERWLHNAGGPEKRIARDVDNVELFVEYLIDNPGIRFAALTECDLRLFVYDWFPRKVMTSKTHAMSMLGSLRRFFEYLAEAEGIEYPWAKMILRDRDAYEARHEEFPGGFWWDEGVGEWRGELYADLDQRVMLPTQALTKLGTWGDMMGIHEASLHRELERQWLRWREDVIASGMTEPADVRAALVKRQHEWEQRAHPRFSKPVYEVIANERNAMEKPRP